MGGARQLHLFKGPRQRGVEPPPPLEFNTHVALADMLRDWCDPAWQWTHFPAGEDRGHITVMRKGKAVRFSPAGHRAKRMGTKKGWPDFQFFHAEGACAFLELKRGKRGVVSDEQNTILTFLVEAGHHVKVAYKFDEAILFLKSIGVLQQRVRVT